MAGLPIGLAREYFFTVNLCKLPDAKKAKNHVPH